MLGVGGAGRDRIGDGRSSGGGLWGAQGMGKENALCWVRPPAGWLLHEVLGGLRCTI